MATYSEVWEAYDDIKNVLGGDALADAIAKALDTDTLESTLAYIARCEDIELSVKIKEK